MAAPPIDTTRRPSELTGFTPLLIENSHLATTPVAGEFGNTIMGTQRFHFADEPPHPQPRRYWFTRMLVTGVIVGCASAAHIVLGFRLF